MTFRTLQLRRNTAALAAVSNPVLAAGEPGYETDTGLLKIGDGSTEWTSLRYYRPPPLDVVGIEWDKSSSSPTLTRIDEYGESVGNLTSAWFDAHPTWGNRWRCVRNRTTGAITYGSNARGDGLTLDGSAGDVIVREPAFYYRFDQSGNKYRWWISPTERPGFTVHPHFNQRGDSSNNTSDLMYTGAYEGSFRVKSDDNTLYLASATGRQPWTGGADVSDGIFRLGFDPERSLVCAGVHQRCCARSVAALVEMRMNRESCCRVRTNPPPEFSSGFLESCPEPRFSDKNVTSRTVFCEIVSACVCAKRNRASCPVSDTPPPESPCWVSVKIRRRRFWDLRPVSVNVCQRWRRR